MGAVTTLQCDVCDASTKLEGEARVYVMEDGGEVPIFATPGWCSACAAVVEAEVLPEPEAVEARSQMAPLLSRWREWRNVRKSLPRCLVCASTKILVAPGASFLFDDASQQSFPHPGCDGQFRVKGVGFANLKRDPRRYSPEGLRLKALANASQKPDA